MEEEIRELMEDYEIDEETAETMQKYIDEGVNEDEALEIAEDF